VQVEQRQHLGELRRLPGPGRPGLGKSTLVRRIVNVSAAFGIIPLILADLKPDYPDLVRALGGQIIEVGRGRGHVNPLDPGSLATELHRLPPDTRGRVEAEQLGRALNVLTGLCELVRGGRLTDRERSMLTAALRITYAQNPAPLIEDVVAVIAARHPRVRAMSLDRGEDARYDDAIELLLASLMALGEDGQFGDTFARPTTTPMALDRVVVFDVSAIDTAELTLGPDRPIKPTGHGQNEAPDTVGFLGEAGRPQFGVPMEPRLSVRCKSRRRSGGWRRHP